MAYGDSIGDWITNPAAAWQAVNARVQLAALRFDQRRKRIPTLQQQLTVASSRVAAMPAGAAKNAELGKISQARAALDQLQAEASGLVGRVMEAVHAMSDAGARVNAETIAQPLGGLGQIQIIAAAVLVGVIAVAAAALAWSTKFDSKLGLFNAGIAAGLSAQDAAKMAASGGVPSNPFGLDLNMVLLAVGAFVLLPKLMDMRRGSRRAA